MLTKIRNAIRIKSEFVSVQYTKMTMSIVKILLQEGFIESFEETFDSFDNSKFIRKYILISLKYKGIKKDSYITSFKRVSKPGLRVYVTGSKTGKVLGGIGVAVFSKRLVFFKSFLLIL